MVLLRTAHPADPEMTIILTPEIPLPGDYDPVSEAAKIGPAFVVKGMFFSQLGKLLEADFIGLQRQLSQPPRLGRYLPFSDYPQSDYAILAAEVARRLYPDVSLKEGIRRLSRNDFHVFAQSTLGRVVLAAVGDVRSALRQVPHVYLTVAPGDWQITLVEHDLDNFRIEFLGHPSIWAYQLGQLEGVIAAFRARARIEVFEPRPRDVVFDIELLD